MGLVEHGLQGRGYKLEEGSGLAPLGRVLGKDQELLSGAIT